MEQNRPKGRGLEEVAHFYFSSPQASGGETRGPAPARNFGLISFCSDLPTSFLVGNLGIELGRQRRKVLMADTASSALNLFFALGMPRSFVPIERFLNGDTVQVVAGAMFGTRILTFLLDPIRIGLLKANGRGGSFKAMVREEQESDIFLIGLHPEGNGRHAMTENGSDGHRLSGSDRTSGSVRMARAAQQVIVAVGPGCDDMLAGYRFVKSLWSMSPQSRIGFLSVQPEEPGETEQNPCALAEAVERFLGRKIRSFGVLVQDPSSYAWMLRGRPFSRMSLHESHTASLRKVAKDLSEPGSMDPSLRDLLRGSDQGSFLDAISVGHGPAEPADASRDRLNADEMEFFERLRIASLTDG